MNVGDEGSGAHLSVFVDEHSTVEQMDPIEMTQHINTSFSRWGLPKEIKIDNGHPFVSPNGRDSPTKSILWWVGLGITVTQNTPRRPQENGIVECLQGTMYRWSNPKSQVSVNALQDRLNEESDFQRNHYCLIARNGKTRNELYPMLQANERVYNPDNFDMKLVDTYLSKKVLYRPVGKNGLVRFMGETVYVGRKYFKECITVTFDPLERLWMIRKEDGTLLKMTVKGVPSKEVILNFAVSTIKNTT